MNQDKTVSSPGMAFPDVIVEQVSNGCFVVWDRNEGKFQALNDPHMFWRDEKEYMPLEKLPWMSITLPCDYESEKQLFDEIRQFFVEHLDVANDLLFDVYACFVMATWRPEDFTVVPYQFFLGPLASGKSRALECFHRLCYRGIMSTSMSAASLFRALEAWHPTLLLDETEVYHRKEMVEVLALLNSGYRRGQYAIRIEKVEEGCPQIAMFDTFGFKVLAGTKELAATLQSRCIISTMSRAVRNVNLFVDEEKGQELRNKLLMYRFRNLGKKAENFDVSRLNGFFRNARVIELFVSLFEVAPEEVKPRLEACMKRITQSRLDEEQASIEARIFDAINNCEHEVKDGKLSTQAITESFNKDLPEKEKATSRFIGRMVVRLGFEKCRLSGGPSGFFWDKALIERLTARYYPQKSTSLTSQTSQTSLLTEKPATPEQPKSEVSEVIPSQHSLPSTIQNSVKSEVSEESEVSEVTLEGIASKVLKLERLTGNFEDKCVACGFTGRMDWQATFHNQTWTLLCDKCGLELGKRLNKNE